LVEPTLYNRFQIQPPTNYTGNTVELQDAYAKSYNSPMAIVGYDVGSSLLKSTAQKLGYNKQFEKNF
jgi:membrane peptidoglycan carboxypeptidase